MLLQLWQKLLQHLVVVNLKTDQLGETVYEETWNNKNIQLFPSCLNNNNNYNNNIYVLIFLITSKFKLIREGSCYTPILHSEKRTFLN